MGYERERFFMDVLNNLVLGFSVALTPINILYCFLGVLAGTIIGILPGIGPVSGIAMLIPFSFGMNPTSAIIMMAGIYYGAMYGGSTTSILINMPGESASVMTCIDGYQLARKGRAGAALGMAAFASFIAGTFSVVGLMVLSPPLAKFALRFGPPEYFALAFLGLTAISSLGGSSLLKGLISGVFGMMIAMIGTDPISGASRFCYGIQDLIDGLSFISVSVGLFAIGEVMETVEGSLSVSHFKSKLSGLLPDIDDWRASKGALVRGSIIGFIVGVLPGAGATIASMLAYAVEKRISKHPEKFGTGIIEGVAAPEGANNSATGGALVPLLTLGIPGGAATAVMLGGLMIHGLRPGPLLFKQHGDFVWGLIASMYIGNIMLLILNLPLVRVFASILRIPRFILLPMVVVFSALGVYSVNNSLGEVYVMFIFGIIGYFMRKLDFPAAPVVLAIVLTPLMERTLRQSLMMSRMDLTIFFTRPVSCVLMTAALLSLFYPLLRYLWSNRDYLRKRKMNKNRGKL